MKFAVACLIALCAGCLAGCVPGHVASDATSTSRTSHGPVQTTMRVLQMNLCNSGRAECYTGGRAVPMAAALIHEYQPQMTSLNEVCRDDLRVLAQAMSATWPAGSVATAFTSAKDRPSQAPVRCENGQEFGDGVLAVVPSPAFGVRSYSGIYPAQDPVDPEERVWVCIAVASRFSACTTHTASADSTVALEQCRYLLNSVEPRIGRGDGGDRTVLGADLNLPANGSPGPQSCLPTGYQRADDAGLQDVVVSPGIRVRSHSVIDMQGTTDHPGLLVDLLLPPH